MKYLTKELYIKCFWGNDYEQNDDKFLIGYCNIAGNRIKDVVTGQIIEGDYFEPIKHLTSYAATINNMALGYMTGLRACDATAHQRLLAMFIDCWLKGDVVDFNQIAKIKNIMNNQVIKTHNKELKKREKLTKREEKLLQYSIDDSEKNF